MPNSQTLDIRNAIDNTRQVRDAYAALTDLALGDGSAPTSDDCFSGLRRQNLITLIDILNDRLMTCLDEAMAECDKLDETHFQAQRQTRQQRS